MRLVPRLCLGHDLANRCQKFTYKYGHQPSLDQMRRGPTEPAGKILIDVIYCIWLINIDNGCLGVKRHLWSPLKFEALFSCCHSSSFALREVKSFGLISSSSNHAIQKCENVRRTLCSAHTYQTSRFLFFFLNHLDIPSGPSSPCRTAFHEKTEASYKDLWHSHTWLSMT